MTQLDSGLARLQFTQWTSIGSEVSTLSNDSSLDPLSKDTAIMQDSISSQACSLSSREAKDHAEGAITRSIEYQMAKLPSDFWLCAAFSSIGVALYFKLNGMKDNSLFVGQWAAPLLLMGVYLKLVKTSGSDRVHRES